jgi:hypothetical protein
MYTTHTLSVDSPHIWKPFTVTQQSWTDSLLLKKVLPTPPLSSAEWPVGPTSISLPNTSIEAVRLSQTSVNELATRLTWSILPACDQYIQYLLTGANPSVLNRHRRGLQPWMCRLTTLHSLTFPTDSPPLST